MTPRQTLNAFNLFYNMSTGVEVTQEQFERIVQIPGMVIVNGGGKDGRTETENYYPKGRTTG